MQLPSPAGVWLSAGNPCTSLSCSILAHALLSLPPVQLLLLSRHTSGGQQLSAIVACGNGVSTITLVSAARCPFLVRTFLVMLRASILQTESCSILSAFSFGFPGPYDVLQLPSPLGVQLSAYHSCICRPHHSWVHTSPAFALVQLLPLSSHACYYRQLSAMPVRYHRHNTQTDSAATDDPVPTLSVSHIRPTTGVPFLSGGTAAASSFHSNSFGSYVALLLFTSVGIALRERHNGTVSTCQHSAHSPWFFATVQLLLFARRSHGCQQLSAV